MSPFLRMFAIRQTEDIVGVTLAYSEKDLIDGPFRDCQFSQIGGFLGERIKEGLGERDSREILGMFADSILWEDEPSPSMGETLSQNFETVSERLNQPSLVAGSHLLGGEHE